RPRRSSRRPFGALAHHPQPGGVALQAPIHRRLDIADGLRPPEDARAAGDRLVPHALHVRLYLAVAVGAHSAAGTVAQVLRAVHGTGHAGRTEDALPAHTAIEEEA